MRLPVVAPACRRLDEPRAISTEIESDQPRPQSAARRSTVQVDGILGEFTAELDGDDTLILVSDHGIWGTLHHDPSCILVLDGPGIEPGGVFGTIPIGHFPSVVLSRFGIETGSDRLTDEERRLFYGD